MDKHTKIAAAIGFIFLILGISSSYAYISGGDQTSFSSDSGGTCYFTMTSEGAATLQCGTSTPPSCVPSEIASQCCKIVKNKNQCINRCNAKATQCGWNNAQADSCKTDVNSNILCA